MIVMEGLMSVPPERGTILGRAIWKPRHVVFGNASPMRSRSQSVADNSGRSSAARRAIRDTSALPSLVDLSQTDTAQQGLFLSIYKAKGDKEIIAQHNLTSFKSCEVRALMHRKGGHTLPTLMLEFKPDTSSEKARKRRSSRTSGLTTKDPWSNILLFRTVPDDQNNIYDWQAAIKPYITPDGLFDNMIAPAPYFQNFSNPFASRENSVRRSDVVTRGSDRNMSSYPHAPRERPSAIISPSPSLRSRRSDVSSQASSQHPTMGFAGGHSQVYPTTLPVDLPSPASTSYEAPFIEGWTSAQGRSSALSSHTRGSNSITSAATPSVSQFASTPPGPRETILDRAFQMKVIPGSERISEQNEDQLTSLARFEALMREVDEKKFEKSSSPVDSATKDISEWNPDDDSEDSDSGEPDVDQQSSDEVEGLELSDDDDVGIPTQAQLAIEFISGRRTPIPGRRPLSPAPATPPVPFINNQAMSAFHGRQLRTQSPTGLRPRTGTNTTPASNHFSDNHFQRFLPTRSYSSAAVNTNSSKDITRPELPHRADTLSADTITSKDKRASRDSVKRLSFQEFTRRLSSTSSLLLVQTNVSGGGTSARSSYEDHGGDQKETERPGLKNRNCSWRGSVGAFGNEGGFL